MSYRKSCASFSSADEEGFQGKPNYPFFGGAVGIHQGLRVVSCRLANLSLELLKPTQEKCVERPKFSRSFRQVCVDYPTALFGVSV